MPALCVIALLLVLGGGAVVYFVRTSPFKYPYATFELDVTGMRNPAIEDCIDKFLMDDRFVSVQREINVIRAWKSENSDRAESSLFRRWRKVQYDNALDDAHAFVFNLVRRQTRYTQRNYVKYAYHVNKTVGTFRCSYDYLEARHGKLKDIGYACTLRAYDKKNQRSLMTRQLREQIMQRDNYTCRKCGKHMPDEVGLHIDHIVPVSKGGKSIPSNLQVLCSKCNLRKSDKL